MRYTTIIDVTEVNAVWQNWNIARVYLYLALKCGYHDTDRDFIMISTRVLAERCGITHAACRHALGVLQREKLIAKAGKWWRVRKYVEEQPITTRAKQEKAARQTAAEKAAIAARDAQQKAIESDIIARKKSNEGFIKYFEELERRAAMGDEEARRIAEQRRPIYESIKKDMK